MLIDYRLLFTTVLIGIFILTLSSLLWPQPGLTNVGKAHSRLIVAELFTSQSCSSCPAADKVLSELSQYENVIALSCHVTYWNHLQWKDTLSTPFCTDRQRAYNRKIRNSRRVYTPQLVVNGESEFVGSDRRRAQKLLTETRGRNVHAVNFSYSYNILQLELETLSPAQYQLWLLSYQDRHTEHVERGENRGRTLAYHNVVRDAHQLDRWDGQKLSMKYEIPPLTPGTNGLVLVIQESSTGHIKAAGRLRF